jgi:hypothetical protein
MAEGEREEEAMEGRRDNHDAQPPVSSVSSSAESSVHGIVEARPHAGRRRSTVVPVVFALTGST